MQAIANSITATSITGIDIDLNVKSIIINIISGFMADACVSFLEKRKPSIYQAA